MSNTIEIKVRSLDGSIILVTVPQNSTVLIMKQKLHRSDPSCPHYLQKLLMADSEELVDDRFLSSYPAIKNGVIVNLLRLSPWELYVTDMHGKQHTVAIPSKTPKEYNVTDFRRMLEETIGETLDGYRIIFNGKECVETKEGKKTTLGDYCIEKEETIIIGQMTRKRINPSVDVCFMVDCTGSMQQWIQAVKDNILQLRDKLEDQFSSCDLRFGFVRYTDYDQPAHTQITKLDFTRDPLSFRQFVGAIEAKGGKDIPEDIMGALNVTLTALSWREGVDKVLIHIADAPCHGTQYHNLEPQKDKYPNGDPAGISHDQMMQLVMANKIHYWFGYVQKDATDKMISVFNKSLRRLSDHRFTIRQVDATNTEQLADTLFKSVKGTIFASDAARQSAVQHFVFDQTIPEWMSVPQVHCLKTVPVSIPCIDALETGLMVTPEPTFPICIQFAPNPFVEGEEYVSYHAYDFINKQQIVLKQFKRNGAEYNNRECYNKKLLIHTISTAYANEFIKEKAQPMGASSLAFIPTDLVQCTKNGLSSYYILQQYIDGRFEKFNSNCGLVFNPTQWFESIQAFSHYTYMKSGKTLLVCNLHGVVSQSGVSLGNPSIHSRTEDGNSFGPTDLGFTGIEQFMKTHKCGETCRRLGLY